MGINVSEGIVGETGGTVDDLSGVVRALEDTIRRLHAELAQLRDCAERGWSLDLTREEYQWQVEHPDDDSEWP